MKKIIKTLAYVTLLSSALVTGITNSNNSNDSFIEYASDNFNKGKVDIKRFATADETISLGNKIYTQIGTSETSTSTYLRFAAPVKGNVTKVTYTRHSDGIEDKVVSVDTLYSGIQSGEKIYYYTDKGLVEEKPETVEYYWACYTIEFKESVKEQYLKTDFKLTLNVEGLEQSLSRTSSILENQTDISLKNNDDFEWFINKTKTNDFSNTIISLDFNYTEKITSVLYPSSELRFNGTFKGNDKTLNLELTGVNNISLFGYVGSDGIVENIKTTGTVKGTGTATNNIASIASVNYGTIKGCVNEATIYNQGHYAGGIVGTNAAGASIENCINKGSVGKDENGEVVEGGYMFGGIAGKSNAKSNIVGCKNYGTILGKASGDGTGGVGGIVGVISGATISNCENGYAENETKTLISSGGNLGGIAGSIQDDNSTISECKNYMNINGESTIGGIVGCVNGKSEKTTKVDIKGIVLKNCDNYGNITASGIRVGGIAGRLKGSGETQSNNKTLIDVDGCYNFGNISSTKVLADNKNYVGGLFGMIGNITIKNSGCYNEILLSYGDTKDVKASTISERYSSDYNKYKKYVFMIAGYGSGAYVDMEATVGLCDKEKNLI